MSEITGLAATILVFVTAFYTAALVGLGLIVNKVVMHLVLENKKAWRMVASLSENPNGMAASSLSANFDLAEDRINAHPPTNSRLEDKQLAGSY